jgi:hypothetical protein
MPDRNHQDTYYLLKSESICETIDYQNAASSLAEPAAVERAADHAPARMVYDNWARRPDAHA